ncbi:MAG: hypothetical protein ACI4SZ_03250, partial [Lachnospiraceae bacterium]
LSVTVFAVKSDPTNLQVGSKEEAQKTTSVLLTPTGSNACNSNIGFSARKTLRMSLVKLDQPFDFDLTSEIFSVSYAQAVQLYGSNYYVTCPEEALYYPVSGDNSMVAGLGIEEMAGNIVTHGFSGKKGELSRIFVIYKKGILTLRIRDNYRKYDPK